MISAGATMMANASRPVAEGGGFGALGTGLAAGLAGVDNSLKQQQAASEQRAKDAFAAAKEQATLQMEQQRLDAENVARASADKLRVAQEQKLALAEKAQQVADQKDAESRVAALKTVDDAGKSKMLLAMMDAPKADWWKAYQAIMAEPKLQLHEVAGVGLVGVKPDGTTATLVPEIRKPETDLFTPLVNPQTGEVNAFDRRSGNVLPTGGNAGPRGQGTMDHDAAAAVRLLSGQVPNADPDFINSFKVTKPGPPKTVTDADGNTTTQPSQILDGQASIAKYKQLYGGTPASAAAAPAAASRTPPPIPPAVAAQAATILSGPGGEAALRAQLARKFAPADVNRIVAAAQGAVTGY
jgi:hypothetical protein